MCSWLESRSSRALYVAIDDAGGTKMTGAVDKMEKGDDYKEMYERRMRERGHERRNRAWCLLELGLGVEARLPHIPEPCARTSVVTTGLGADEIWGRVD